MKDFINLGSFIWLSQGYISQNSSAKIENVAQFRVVCWKPPRPNEQNILWWIMLFFLLLYDLTRKGQSLCNISKNWVCEKKFERTL